jgi:hypothetical protein
MEGVNYTEGVLGEGGIRPSERCPEKKIFKRNPNSIMRGFIMLSFLIHIPVARTGYCKATN